jgi:hypothetical protein
MGVRWFGCLLCPLIGALLFGVCNQGTTNSGNNQGKKFSSKGKLWREKSSDTSKHPLGWASACIAASACIVQKLAFQTVVAFCFVALLYICAGSEAKICAKYAQNMRNLKNGAPDLMILTLLLQNMMIFWSGKSADPFKYLFNFFEKFWSFGGSKIFWRSKNIHPKPIILMALPQKIAKYA